MRWWKRAFGYTVNGKLDEPHESRHVIRPSGVPQTLRLGLSPDNKHIQPYGDLRAWPGNILTHVLIGY